jgi:hypothetical protein
MFIKWEYLVDKFHYESWDDLQEKLNKRGREGWKAFSVESGLEGETLTALAMFRRPVLEDILFPWRDHD